MRIRQWKSLVQYKLWDQIGIERLEPNSSLILHIVGNLKKMNPDIPDTCKVVLEIAVIRGIPIQMECCWLQCDQHRENLGNPQLPAGTR